MMIDCREAARLVSRAMDERLPLWQRLRLRLHLALCDACSNFSRQVRLLRRGIARLLER